MKRKAPLRPRRRAAALAFALIMTVCLAACAFAVLGVAGQEHKLTSRRVIQCESINAIESAINYGAAQIVRITGKGASVSEDFLQKRPLAVPVDGAYGPKGLSTIDSSMMTLHAGRALIMEHPYQISTGNPTSITDEQKSQSVYMKTVPLLATATVPVSGGPPMQIHAKAHVVIRDNPLFNYAVFYNNIPLEIAPGGPLTLGGAVHSNSNIYLGGAGGAVTVTGSVASAGKIIAGRDAKNSGMGSSVSDIFVPYTDANNNGFYDAVPGWTYDGRQSTPHKDGSSFKNAELINMKITDKDGKTYVLDNSKPDNADGTRNDADWKEYVTTVTKGNVKDSSLGVNSIMPNGIDSKQGSEIIQPPITDPNAAGYDANIEAAKYGNKAGMYLFVEPNGTVTAFQNATDASAYKKTGTVAARESWKAANPGKVINLTGTGVVTTGSFIDRRENKAVTSVDLNMSNLRSYVAGTSPAGAPAFADKTSYELNAPDLKGWNGVVYVDVENPSTGWQPFTRKDSNGNPVATASTLTAVRVTDATKVPNRSETDARGSQGFTLATNAPLYTLGSVNADGAESTGSNSKPDSGSLTKLGTETAVSFAADAITPLSSNWKDANSYQTDSANAAGFTEISAALMVGVVKSANGTYSGGLENFPRLLEQWSGKLRIRGSMVAMYESKWATGKWGGNYYSIPPRDWGFSGIFGSGKYPPGTPILRSYRRMAFRILSEAEYNAEAASSWTKEDGTTTPKFPW